MAGLCAQDEQVMTWFLPPGHGPRRQTSENENAPVDGPNKRKPFRDGWVLKNKSCFSPSPPPLHKQVNRKARVLEKEKFLKEEKKLPNIIVH